MSTPTTTPADPVDDDGPAGFDPADLIVQKPPSGLNRLFSPLYKNFVQPLVDKARKKVVLNEKRMLRKEEQMKQDVERILMEIEEQHSWIRLGELNCRNLERMKKEELIQAAKRKEERKQAEEFAKINIEQGLSFMLGNVKSFEKWQNSNSKFQDIKGHANEVFSVKLSKCGQYVLSAGADNKACLWDVREGKTRYPLLTYEGHTRKVLDCDIHKDFVIDSTDPLLCTCSADGTLRFWDSKRERPAKIIEAHQEAIYRSRFSPDGTRVLTCSEDKTLKIWAFPEGYSLHCFKGHQSGVTSAAFSPTGRWIVSGSDYGERKILLWDANMPYFEKPVQYPHQIFWTPEGMIRKILIRQRKPTPYFWFSADQLQLLGEKAKVESWTGEYEEIEMADDSDGDDEQEVVVTDEFGKDDVREFKGATLQAFYTDKDGKTSVASEYMPGGQLTFTVECSDVQIADAFISVTALDTAYDAFSTESGKRLGNFIINYPLPWKMDTAKIDPLGIRKPERIGDDLPEGLLEVDENQALVYRNKEPVLDDDGNVIEETESKFGVVWFCPGPMMGPARITVNFRFQKVPTWQTLTYSLKESPIRVASALVDGKEEAVVQYTFDQEARHLAFFNYIRDKNWDAVQSFIDKKAVMFKDKILRKRRWRIMDSLEDIFMDAEAMVLPAPVIFKGGHTKSTLLMEYTPYFYKKRPRPVESDEEMSEEEDEEEMEEPADDDEEAEADADAEGEEEGEAGESLDIAEVAVHGVDDHPSEEGHSETGSAKADSDAGADADSVSTTRPHIPELEVTQPGTDVSSKYRVEDDEEDEANTDAEYSDEEVEVPLSPIVEDKPDVDDVGDDGNGADGADVGGDDAGISSKSEHKAEENSEKIDEIDTGVVSARDATPLTPKPEGKHDETTGGSAQVIPLNSEIDGEQLGEEASIAEGSLAEGSLDSSLGSMSLEAVESLGPEVDPDEEIVHRHRTKKLHLKEFIFAGEVEGKHFARQVEHLAENENAYIMFNKFSRVHAYKELRLYAANPALKEELMSVPGIPKWVSKVEIKSPPEYGSSSSRLGYYDLAKHPYLKSTLYGPDIQKFTMDLPANFPRKAARSVNAFSLQLSQYEAARRRTEANAVALSADSIEGEDGNEFGAAKSSHERHMEVMDCLRPEVALHLISQRSYLATRRNCLAELPGMQNHYPNPNYLEPCIDYPFMPLAQVSSGFFGGSKTAALRIGQVVSPVGRRKEYPDYYNDVEKYLADKAEAAREETRKLFGIKKKPEEFIGGDGENPNYVAPDHDEETSSVKGGNSEVQEESAKTGTEVVEKSTTDDPAVENVEDEWDEHGNYIKKKKKHKHKHKHKHTEEEVKAEPVEDPEEVAARLTKEAEEAAAASKQAAVEAEKQRRSRLGIPQDVFLGRRGSFCAAPGLEPFEDGAKAKPHHAQPTKDKKDDSLNAWMVEEDLLDENGEIDLNKSHGLIRKCINLLGNDIVHHGSVNDVAFAPSENRMASAGGDKLVKIWDPRDGTLVRVLAGHTGEVTALRYSHDELYLVSCDSEAVTIIWDMTTNLIFKKLYGHADAITSLDMSPDCTMMVSSSYDKIIKTWYLTPRVPAAPDPPRVISHTDKTVILAWTAPAAFNLDISAFYIQYRVYGRNYWEPLPDEPAVTAPPTSRSKTLKGLISGTQYQFRIRAQNLMGIGPWSIPSKLMKTELGVPDKVEMPRLCGCSIDTMTIYFFTPNPDTFGGASQQFEARYSGNVTDFADSPIKSFTLDEAVEDGKKVLDYFRKKLEVKPIKIVQRADKKDLPKELDMGFQIADEFMQKILEKVEVDNTMLFVATTIHGLEPGFEYRIEVRGVNEEDKGPWSEGSYSYSTHATNPRPPNRAFIEERTLTSIKFAWHAPDGRGTAIVGYIVEVQHTGKQFKLPRSQQWMELDHLLPGKSYYLRLKSLNAVGESEWSQYNTIENSYTLTAKPEKPSRPVAVHGTWKNIVIESRIPYNNGAIIRGLVIHKRWVETFNKGEWENPIHMTCNLENGEMDQNIEVTEFVAADAYIQKLLQEEREEAEERKKGFNPFKAKKEVLSLSAKLDKAKPEGSLLRITVGGLKDDTIYEFRVAYENMNGASDNSDASHRAKTNAALPPEAPLDFRLFDTALGDKFDDPRISKDQRKDKSFMYFAIATFYATFDRQGGAFVTQYVIQCRNNTVDKSELEQGIDPALSAATHYVTIKRNPPGASMENVYFHVEDLVPGNAYQFRIRADNEGANDGIPVGIYSEWTEEIIMPELPTDEGDEDGQSIPTLKTEPTYVESDEDEVDDDSILTLDVLDQELPTSRNPNNQPHRKDAVLLKAVGKKGEGKVKEQERVGMNRRGGVNEERSKIDMDPGSSK